MKSAIDIVKTGVLLFMMELLQKSHQTTGQNEDLFYFIEDALMQLDQTSDKSQRTSLYLPCI